LNELIRQTGPLIPLAIFALFWLYVMYTLDKKSGWFLLAKRYPNKLEPAILKLRLQSGWIGSVSGSGTFRFEACPSGLRVGKTLLFAPFSRDFFVPWNEIAVERKRKRLFKVAELRFGNGEGDLTVPDFIANKLARAVSNRWPEPGSFPPDTYFTAFRIAFTHWLAVMAFIVGFITLVPALFSGKLGTVPLQVPEIFGTMLGLICLREFLLRTRE
jgi:hypothetical protein